METLPKLRSREYEVHWHWRHEEYVKVGLKSDRITAVSVQRAIKNLIAKLREEYSFEAEEVVVIEVNER